MGLSSIATLSLGLSMSMAGAGRAVIRSLGPGHRQALQQFFPVVPPPSAVLDRLREAGEESAESKGDETTTTSTTATREAVESTGRGGGEQEAGKENGWVGQTRPPTVVTENERLPKSTSRPVYILQPVGQPAGQPAGRNVLTVYSIKRATSSSVHTAALP